jgi:hypothetical protein
VKSKYAQDYVNNLIAAGLNLDHSNDLRSSGNIANHGFVSPLMAFLQRIGILPRPNVSDYQYQKMRERGSAAEKEVPSIIASNPNLKMFGRLGENTLFQGALDSVTPGGSRVNAYKSVLGNLVPQMRGHGNANIQEDAESAKNIFDNLENQMKDSTGNWDYNKSIGFNRSEMVNNLSTFKKRFG